MRIAYADIALASDMADGTWLITAAGGVMPYRPENEYGTNRGYAVALCPAFSDGDETTEVEPWELIGTWYDQSTGILHIDRVLHVKGGREQALHLARAFDQKAIYDFQTGDVITVEGLVIHG